MLNHHITALLTANLRAHDAIMLSAANVIHYIPVNNTLMRGQDGRHFPYDIFKCIFATENVSIFINTSLKFVPTSQINNIPALVQIMACCRPDDKPLYEPIMVILLMHICVTRPQ